MPSSPDIGFHAPPSKWYLPRLLELRNAVHDTLLGPAKPRVVCHDPGAVGPRASRYAVRTLPGLRVQAFGERLASKPWHPSQSFRSERTRRSRFSAPRA